MKFFKKSTGYFLLILVLFAIPLLGVLGVLINRIVITPNDQFFNVSIGPSPQINSSTWLLSVEGYINHSLTFDYSNFTALPSIEVIATIQCVDGPAATAVWKGVPLKDILTMVQPQNGAVDVVFYAADSYSSSLTVEEASVEDVLLAYEMNGEPLPVDQGYPLRVVAPNHSGYKWVKWVVKIEIVDYDYIGYWESRGWNDNAQLAPISDWVVHAMLFSVAFMFGGLSMVSGYITKHNEQYSKHFPAFFSRKFHIGSSISYFLISTSTFTYWISNTFINRGSVFYTSHGIISVVAIGLLTFGFVTGLSKLRKKKFTRWHANSNLWAFCFFILTIAFGFFLAIRG